jgi:uncharacterized membrane protein
VRILEITINAKQMIAVIWTLIAIVLSLLVTLATGLPNSIIGSGVSTSPAPWWAMIAVFFGVLLLVTLPVYLLIALWALATKPENE